MIANYLQKNSGLVQNSAVKVDLKKQRTVIKSRLDKICSLQKKYWSLKKNLF